MFFFFFFVEIHLTNCSLEKGHQVGIREIYIREILLSRVPVFNYAFRISTLHYGKRNMGEREVE